MTPEPPTRAELEALAERALAHVSGEGQTTAWWEWTLEAPALVRVEVLVVRDGRAGRAQTDRLDEDGLAAAAGAAELAAADGSPCRPLPEPAPGRAHDGYDPAALTPPPSVDGLTWRQGAARTAIASTRVVRAYEQRTYAAALASREGGGCSARLEAAAVGPGGVDAEGLAREAAELVGAADPRGAAALQPVAPGEPVVVLGHDAVAAVLDALRRALGAMRDRVGTRVAAPCINLSDSPRFAATLPRSYDALGAPLAPAPLIQDGVLHRVLDRLPWHLVLVGGGRRTWTS